MFNSASKKSLTLHENMTDDEFKRMFLGVWEPETPETEHKKRMLGKRVIIRWRKNSHL